MHPWQAEPLWAFFDRLRSPVRIAASDTLVVALTERAALPRRVGTYKSLDQLRAGLKAGYRGVIIRS